MLNITKFTAVAALVVTLAGCEQGGPSREVQTAAGGAAIGALAGAAIGGSRSDVAAGALLGGVAGAAVAANN